MIRLHRRKSLWLKKFPSSFITTSLLLQYEKECGYCTSVVSYVGHSHIDVAWQWTLAQTREKIQRTTATALRLMEKYPEYIFMESQPQLYEYLKEESPELYEQVKSRVKEGRWEIEGAMWLEADCNLTSGESLIRQILHGKKFIKEEFGVESHVLWLPDVFGYSAALPQILKKSGIDKFVTTKIGWSETNKMPYDTFMWEGIDGTEIFTYFLSCMRHERLKEGYFNTTYVGRIEPSLHLGTWERYQQKEFNNDVLVTFGYGDGGGGPTAEMLESGRRLKYGLPGMPKAEMTHAGEFLDRVEETFKESCRNLKRTPKWVGELYLELHRGTYTSIAKNKKNNRECEFLCQETESLAVTNGLLFGEKYPKEVLDRNWKRLLLNQFHDIIPGSSIKEVYEDSERDYEAVYKEIGGTKRAMLEKIGDNVNQAGLLVYNPNSHKVSGYVKKEDNLVYAENVPAFGWKVVREKTEYGVIEVSDKIIDSPHYRIVFDDNMNIISIFDKDNDREVVEQGKTANQLRVFEDYPKEWDNWEITDYYKQKMWEVNNVECAEPVKKNGAGGFKIVRKYMNSTIIQTIWTYEKSRRIDFETEAEWQENHVLLKAAFPTTIHTNKASYEIQFGNVERPNHENTSWDRAKFEVCAQKWGDLSEEGYGVSILNNCKYGHSASGNEMSITLIKCGTFPNEEADRGHHSFTYSLYPHSDNFKQGGTIQEAYLLNRPLEAIETSGGGSLPDEFSLVSCDCDNIVVETVKEAENGNGIIVRLYDAWNKKSKPALKFGFEAKKVSLCDMLENPIEEIGSGSEIKLSVSNFEIITLFIEI
ncbi:MAG: alpha-mannosidase [Monoglobaceae bacterium]